MFSRSPRAYHVLLFDWAGAFLIAQGTLLMLRHPRHAFIKFLQLHVSYILWCDTDPTAKDSAGIWAGIFPLATLPLIQMPLKSISHFIFTFTSFLHTYTEPVNLPNTLVPLQKPRACPRRDFLFPISFLYTLSLYFSIHFSFLCILPSSALLSSLNLLNSFKFVLEKMGRFAYLVDSKEGLENFKA